VQGRKDKGRGTFSQGVTVQLQDTARRQTALSEAQVFLKTSKDGMLVDDADMPAYPGWSANTDDLFFSRHKNGLAVDYMPRNSPRYYEFKGKSMTLRGGNAS
jgi:hypothetical protein